MTIGVSVLICCHNSGTRLPETLRHLAAQKVPGDIPWEVVVIDNASTDDSAHVAQKCWPENHPAPLRVVTETQAGLSHARIRGIAEARHEIISFIDDDNWTAADWIKRVATIFTNYPKVGACGGRIEAVCEITPPDWFELVKLHYAVGSQHSQSGDITDSSGTLLCGAGLSLRTAAVKKLLAEGFAFTLSGRKGNRLSMGEDTELCFAIRASGWRFWYDDDLILQHFIPKERLRWDYVIRLIRGLGEASAFFVLYLIALNAPPHNRRPAWKKSWSFQLLKTLQQIGKIILSHPIESLSHQEGAMPALQFKQFTAQLATLWSLSGSYNRTLESIRRAPWVKSS